MMAKELEVRVNGARYIINPYHYDSCDIDFLTANIELFIDARIQFYNKSEKSEFIKYITETLSTFSTKCPDVVLRLLRKVEETMFRGYHERYRIIDNARDEEEKFTLVTNNGYNASQILIKSFRDGSFNKTTLDNVMEGMLNSYYTEINIPDADKYDKKDVFSNLFKVLVTIKNYLLRKIEYRSEEIYSSQIIKDSFNLIKDIMRDKDFWNNKQITKFYIFQNYIRIGECKRVKELFSDDFLKANLIYSLMSIMYYVTTSDHDRYLSEKFMLKKFLTEIIHSEMNESEKDIYFRFFKICYTFTAKINSKSYSLYRLRTDEMYYRNSIKVQNTVDSLFNYLERETPNDFDIESFDFLIIKKPVFEHNKEFLDMCTDYVIEDFKKSISKDYVTSYLNSIFSLITEEKLKSLLLNSSYVISPTIKHIDKKKCSLYNLNKYDITDFFFYLKDKMLEDKFFKKLYFEFMMKGKVK